MENLRRSLDRISQNPLHRFLGLRDLRAAGGEASLKIEVNENTANPAGVLHGGVAYVLCDVAAYAALLSELAPGRYGVTHDIHVSVIRAAKLGDELVFSGRVVKQGRRVAFLDAQAHVGDELVATARITKTLL